MSGLSKRRAGFWARAQGLWHGLRWLSSPLEYFRQQRHHGGLTWPAFLPGLGPTLLTGDPALLDEVVGHDGLVGGKAHKALRATLGDDHLIVSWGDAHRQRRKIVLQALQAFPSDETVVQLTRQELLPWADGRPFSLYQAVHRASLSIMLQGLVGDLDKPRREEMLEACYRFLQSFRSPLLLYLPWLRRDWGRFSPWGRLLRRRSELMDLLRAIEPAADSIAGRLRPHLPPASYMNETLAQLMFGHETTAASLTWCLAHAFHRPDLCLPILHGDEAYTLAFVQECLRVSPPVGQLTRVAVTDLQVGGWDVKAGEVVMPVIPLAHETVASLSDFQPERFLNGAPSPAAYCPFGLGARLCPGRTAALRQLTVMLATLLGDYRWTARQVSLCPQRHLFLMLPKGGLRVRCRPSPGLTDFVGLDTVDDGE